MPPLARAAIQDSTCSRHSSGRKSTNRAASVPVGQRENSKLESLRSKKQKCSLDIRDASPSSLPTVVIAPSRGRKRDASPYVSPQTNCVASTSTSTAQQTADASEQRPRKRRKRALSTPPAPRPSLPPTQLQPRRRSRSRVGSPSTDVECVLPSRRSARLVRKIHPFFESLRLDIYSSLADPADAGKLLSESPIGPSAIPFAPNETVDSQSVKRPRGRRRKNPDLADESAKKDLMEEWARMRQSQGTLLLSGTNENACSSQTHSDGHQTGCESVLSAIIQRTSPDIDLVETRTTTIIDISQSQSQSPSSSQMNALLVGMGASGDKLDHKISVLPSGGAIEQPIVPAFDIEVPSRPTFGAHLGGDAPTDGSAGIPGTSHDLSVSASPSRGSSIPIQHEKSAQLPANDRADTTGLNNTPKDSHLATVPRPLPLDADSTHFDSDEDFYMLDIPEIFTLPWVPVSSNLYVPPNLGKLISGMREQLMMEARTRRRAEELYQAELTRRVSAEKVIEDLRTQLEQKQQDLSGKQGC